MTWINSMKTINSGLPRVGEVRLPGWGPRDLPKQRLETIGDRVFMDPKTLPCIVL